METINVHSAEDAMVALLKLRRQAFFSFRGQRDCTWPLGPHHKIPDSWMSLKKQDLQERNDSANKEMYRREQAALADRKTDKDDYWKSKSMRKNMRRNLEQFIKHSQLFRDSRIADHAVSLQRLLRAKSERWWNELIFAHHHGLRTLLLDWTSNPLVALYFAVENAVSKPKNGVRGAVFAIKVRGKPSDRDVKGKRWHSFEEVVEKYPFGEFCPFWIMLNPPLNSDRIVRQSGKFSFHPSTTDQLLADIKGMRPEQGLFPDERLVKVEIGKEGRPDPSDDIRRMLGIMNVHRASLFPDHDGVATYLNHEWSDIAEDPSLLPAAPVGRSPSSRVYRGKVGRGSLPSK